MSDRISPQFTTIDGLRVRYATSGGSAAGRRRALLLSPWPETVYAFEQAWDRLSEHADLIAVDPPGFGQSEYRKDLMSPQAMGRFIIRIADAFDLTKPHVVGPDIGTSSALFAAAMRPDRFTSLVIGSGGAAVPIEVTGVLKEWVEAPDLEPYRRIGGGTIVELALDTIDGYEPSDEIRGDYIESYRGDRFADTIPYAQSYREQLPVLADLLPHIEVPVRIVAGANDQVVPPVNAEFLHQRLPNSRVDLIAGAGHFCWEERPAEYAALVTDWWQGAA